MHYYTSCRLSTWDGVSLPAMRTYICIRVHSLPVLWLSTVWHTAYDDTFKGLVTRSGFGFTDALNLLVYSNLLVVSASLPKAVQDSSTGQHYASTVCVNIAMTNYALIVWSPIDEILFKERKHRNGCNRRNGKNDEVITHPTSREWFQYHRNCDHLRTIAQPSYNSFIFELSSFTSEFSH